MKKINEKIYSLKKITCKVLVVISMSILLVPFVARADEGSPDSYGYVWTDTNAPAPTISYTWDEISGTGNVLTTSCDDCTYTVPIGFTFDYYGIPYTDINMSSNGFLQFLGTYSDFSNEPLPSGIPSAKVAPFWDDLKVYSTEGHKMVYETIGSAPNRKFIAQWDVAHYSAMSATYIFQAVLHESGEIEFRYNTMTGSYADGSGATIGIENEDGSVANQYSYNTAAVSSSMAIEFSTSMVLDHMSSDTPISISDASVTTSTITVADSGVVTDVNVGLDISHTNDSDLTITLIAPDGTRVLLVDQRGGSGDDFTETILDDEAATSISSGTAPFSNSFLPEEFLFLLDGMSMTGDWTLEIVDVSAGGTGTLNTWGLDITIPTPPETSITTTFANNSGSGGNMFNVTAINTITIESFDVNVSTFGSVGIEVYYKSGTYVGFETNSGAWTLLGSVTATGAGSGNATSVNIGGLTIPAGDTYGLYVRATSGTMNYTVGANTYSNSDVSLDLGVGVGLLFSSIFTPRTWNGTIHYNSGNPIASNGTLVVIEDVGGGGTLVAVDNELDPIVYEIVSDPLYGTVTLTSSILGTYTYSPDPNFEGFDYFTFNVFDGTNYSNTATINISVYGTPDPPVPTAGDIDTYINTPKSTQVLHNDPDLGDVHSYSISSMASGGTAAVDVSGLATYTPLADFTGPDSFEVLVTDMDSLEGFVTISVMVTAIDANPPVEGSLSVAAGNAYAGLIWSGFTEDLGQITYTLVYDTSTTPLDCSSGMVLYSGMETSLDHTDILNGTTYYYRLCATDSAGNTTPGLTGSATPFVSANGITTTGDDSDFDGIERNDGGDDDHNLDEATGNPITDPGFNFKIVVKDSGGGVAPIAKLYVADRSSPSTYMSYDMLCTGDYTEGELCSYTTILGPSSASSYYFEAILEGGAGSTLRYPGSGDITGPDVHILNSYGVVGASRNLDGADYDSTRAFGCTVAFRWVSEGLSRNRIGNKGHFEIVDAFNTVKTGESYFVRKSSCGNNTSLIELEGMDDIVSDTLEITLQPGWNLINNPYNGDVYLKDIQVQSEQFPYVSWPYAVSQNWLINGIYSYNGKDWGGTYSFESAGGLPEAKLTPWTGYWIYQLKEDVTYKIIIPKP